MHYVSEKFTVYQTLTYLDNIIPCYYYGICYRICYALWYRLSGPQITKRNVWKIFLKLSGIFNPSVPNVYAKVSIPPDSIRKG